MRSTRKGSGVAACAGTASAHGTAGGPGFGRYTTGCPTYSTVQPFAPWTDLGYYFVAPSGDFEGSLSGWTLSSVMEFSSGRPYAGLLSPACTSSNLSFSNCGLTGNDNLNDTAFNEDTLASLSEHDTEAEAWDACHRYTEREIRRANILRYLSLHAI